MTAVELGQSVVGHTFLVLGTVLFGIAGVGLVRYRDPFSRLAATTKSGTVGVCLVLLGVLVLEPRWTHALILLVAVALQLVTAPVGGFAIGRAAVRAGAPLPADVAYDEREDAPRA